MPLARSPRILALVLILGLCASSPAPARAGYRGAFDPFTTESRIIHKYFTPAFRPYPNVDQVERYFAFVTRSAEPRGEGIGEIWLHVTVARAGAVLDDLKEVRVPLLRDPAVVISYGDPAWSPNGRYLAYVKTDPNAAMTAIYVQEFALSDVLVEAAKPIGGPLLVVPAGGGLHRRPTWSPDGSSLAFESTRAGLTFDIYTVEVFPTVGEPVRRTFDDRHAERNAAISPDGTRIAFETNIYGPNQIGIVDLTTPAPHAIKLIERVPVFISHRDPDWSSDGTAIYYEAPGGENAEAAPDIWRFDLATGLKCPIDLGHTAETSVDVSTFTHETPDGIPFDHFLFVSSAGAPYFPTPNIWRGQWIYNCAEPLPMIVDMQPSKLQLGGSGKAVTARLSFPASTRAAGYQCASYDGPLEGMRMRAVVLPSPTLEGMAGLPSAKLGASFPDYQDHNQGGEQTIDVMWDRAEVERMLIDRGTTDGFVGVRIDGYSNGVGRRFVGYGYFRVVANGAAGREAVRIESAAPNPFNPRTRLRFSLGAEGAATVRIVSVRGERVRLLHEGWLAAGRQSLDWDGRDDAGRRVASGVYFAQVTTRDSRASTKLVLME